MTKRKRLYLILGAVVLLLALAAVLVPDAVVRGSTRRDILSPEAAADWGADCILVLGAGLLPDGSPNLMLSERIDTGVALYELGAAPKLLMSGDHARPEYDEVNPMKEGALRQGVPSEDVFMDHAGLSTYESIYRARDIFGAGRVIVVTQAYHLPRSLYIAEALGLEAVGVACDTARYRGQFFRDVREVLARDKDFVKCIFQPEPTYLGEAISLRGSGDVTNDRQ
ncbi:MAG: YdcF family protein [Oscillospiraceae bacterium]|nr:YdcF family protein [Oscillospiraceae bacterium]